MAKKTLPKKKTPKPPPDPTPRSPKAEPGVPGLPLMRIYRFRESDISQEELAGRVGVTQGMISQWESAESDVPLGMVHKLALALNTTADALQTVNPFDPQARVLDVWKDVRPELRPRALNTLKTFTD